MIKNALPPLKGSIRPRCPYHPDKELFNLSDIFRDWSDEEDAWACGRCVASQEFKRSYRFKPVRRPCPLCGECFPTGRPEERVCGTLAARVAKMSQGEHDDGWFRGAHAVMGLVAELVDARDLKSLGDIRGGSIPSGPTKIDA